MLSYTFVGDLLHIEGSIDVRSFGLYFDNTLNQIFKKKIEYEFLDN